MRVIIRSISLLMMAALAAPLVCIAILSFSSNQGMDIFTTYHGSAHWWRELFHDSSWLAALLNSAGIGFLSALLAMLLTLPAALLWRLEKSTAARNALFFAIMSLTIPPIVLAVGLYRTMAMIGMFDTAGGLALSHLAFTVPVASLVLSSRFSATPIDLYLAAKSLGAGRFSASLRWLMATQRNTLFGCVGLCMLTSISEVTVAIYVTDTGVPNIARRALTGITQDISPAGFAAMTAWLLVLTICLFPLALNMANKRRIYE